DPSVFCTGPYSADQVRRNADKPSIRIVIGCPCLSTHRLGQVITPAQASARSPVYYGFQHIHHNISTFFIHHFHDSRCVLVDRGAVFIFNPQQKDRFSPDTMIHECRICTHHVINGCLIGTQCDGWIGRHFRSNPHSFCQSSDWSGSDFIHQIGCCIVLRVCQCISEGDGAADRRTPRTPF